MYIKANFIFYYCQSYKTASAGTAGAGVGAGVGADKVTAGVRGCGQELFIECGCGCGCGQICTNYAGCGQERTKMLRAAGKSGQLIGCPRRPLLYTICESAGFCQLHLLF